MVAAVGDIRDGVSLGFDIEISNVIASKGKFIIKSCTVARLTVAP